MCTHIYAFIGLVILVFVRKLVEGSLLSELHGLLLVSTEALGSGSLQSGAQKRPVTWQTPTASQISCCAADMHHPYNKELSPPPPKIWTR